LHTPKDYAAMDAELSSALPERNRRGFQFSLRMLFIVVTAFYVFVGWIGRGCYRAAAASHARMD
jgi:hypothetical protein